MGPDQRTGEADVDKGIENLMDDPPDQAGVLPVAHADYAPHHRIFSTIPWKLLERGNAAAAGRRGEGTTSTDTSDHQAESRSVEPSEHDPKGRGSRSPSMRYQR